LAEAIIRTLRQAGHEALLAGGCVRDLLLGRRPKDYDVATSARPEEVLRLFPKALTVGAAFGVVIVLEGASRAEVATFRAEGGYSDGRRPDAVRFTDAREDALRRDFTVNGMFLDPAPRPNGARRASLPVVAGPPAKCAAPALAEGAPAPGLEHGRVLDFVGGRADLAARVIRAIGDPARRFAEDHLRMLRAVRLAAELDFAIEPATAEAVRRLAPQIALVSGERVREELARLLTAAPARRRRGLELLSDLGLLAVLLPEVEATKGVAQGPTVHPEGDVFAHTLLALEALREPTFELALATLLHDAGKPATFQVRDGRMTFYRHQHVSEEAARQVAGRLRLSALQARRVEWLVRHHMLLMSADGMREAKLKRLFAEDGFEELAELYRADCLASGGTADAYEGIMARYRALTEEEVRPRPLLSGHDLLGLGLEPGPLFGEILREVYDAQLEARVASKDEALDLVREILKTRCQPPP
jgi:poly(A) polymerase